MAQNINKNHRDGDSLFVSGHVLQHNNKSKCVNQHTGNEEDKGMKCREDLEVNHQINLLENINKKKKVIGSKQITSSFYHVLHQGDTDPSAIKQDSNIHEKQKQIKRIGSIIPSRPILQHVSQNQLVSIKGASSQNYETRDENKNGQQKNNSEIRKDNQSYRVQYSNIDYRNKSDVNKSKQRVFGAKKKPAPYSQTVSQIFEQFPLNKDKNIQNEKSLLGKRSKFIGAKTKPKPFTQILQKNECILQETNTQIREQRLKKNKKVIGARKNPPSYINMIKTKEEDEILCVNPHLNTSIEKDSDEKLGSIKLSTSSNPKSPEVNKFLNQKQGKNKIKKIGCIKNVEPFIKTIESEHRIYESIEVTRKENRQNKQIEQINKQQIVDQIKQNLSMAELDVESDCDGGNRKNMEQGVQSFIREIELQAENHYIQQCQQYEQKVNKKRTKEKINQPILEKCQEEEKSRKQYSSQGKIQQEKVGSQEKSDIQQQLEHQTSNSEQFKININLQQQGANLERGWDSKQLIDGVIEEQLKRILENIQLFDELDSGRAKQASQRQGNIRQPKNLDFSNKSQEQAKQLEHLGPSFEQINNINPRRDSEQKNNYQLKENNNSIVTQVEQFCDQIYVSVIEKVVTIQLSGQHYPQHNMGNSNTTYENFLLENKLEKNNEENKIKSFVSKDPAQFNKHVSKFKDCSQKLHRANKESAQLVMNSQQNIKQIENFSQNDESSNINLQKISEQYLEEIQELIINSLDQIKEQEAAKIQNLEKIDKNSKNNVSQTGQMESKDKEKTQDENQGGQISGRSSDLNNLSRQKSEKFQNCLTQKEKDGGELSHRNILIEDVPSLTLQKQYKTHSQEKRDNCSFFQVKSLQSRNAIQISLQEQPVQSNKLNNQIDENKLAEISSVLPQQESNKRKYQNKNEQNFSSENTEKINESSEINQNKEVLVEMQVNRDAVEIEASVDFQKDESNKIVGQSQMQQNMGENGQNFVDKSQFPEKEPSKRQQIELKSQIQQTQKKKVIERDNQNKINSQSFGSIDEISITKYKSQEINEEINQALNFKDVQSKTKRLSENQKKNSKNQQSQEQKFINQPNLQIKIITPLERVNTFRKKTEENIQKPKVPDDGLTQNISDREKSRDNQNQESNQLRLPQIYIVKTFSEQGTDKKFDVSEQSVIFGKSACLQKISPIQKSNQLQKNALSQSNSPKISRQSTNKYTANKKTNIFSKRKPIVIKKVGANQKKNISKLENGLNLSQNCQQFQQPTYETIGGDLQSNFKVSENNNCYSSRNYCAQKFQDFKKDSPEFRSVQSSQKMSKTDQKFYRSSEAQETSNKRIVYKSPYLEGLRLLTSHQKKRNLAKKFLESPDKYSKQNIGFNANNQITYGNKINEKTIENLQKQWDEKLRRAHSSQKSREKSSFVKKFLKEEEEEWSKANVVDPKNFLKAHSHQISYLYPTKENGEVKLNKRAIQLQKKLNGKETLFEEKRKKLKTTIVQKFRKEPRELNEHREQESEKFMQFLR